jgi:RNA polymerase sigma-70 factor (ECF subfamily)
MQRRRAYAAWEPFGGLRHHSHMSSSVEQLFHGRENAASTLTDAELVARILGGDQPIYELLMRRYNRLLFRLARSIVHDDDEARDVVQASYVRAYYHLAEFRGPTGFRSWLARIAINEACARTRRAPNFASNDEDGDLVLQLPEMDSAQPENLAIGGEILHLLQTEIDKLPVEFRAVFMLRGVEQLSIAETAAMLDLNPATVKTRFHRARRLLQAALHRQLDDLARETYRFDGTHCDRVVAGVFERIKEV